MRVSVSSSKKKADCLFLILSESNLKKRPSSSASRIIDSVVKEQLFSGKKNECLFLPCSKIGQHSHLLLAGAGPANQIDKERIRQTVGVAYRNIENKAFSSIEVNLSLCSLPLKSAVEKAQAVTEGFLLSHYNFEEFKTINKSKKNIKQIFISGISATAEIKKAIEESTILIDSVNFARYLADSPANFMTPSILAQTTQKKFKGIKGVKLRIWNKEQLKKEKMGGILGVGMGSAQEPRMIIIDYQGAPRSKSKKNKTICLVGKGLTFDTGGISIKPSQNMHLMKFDMCGSAAVIGALLAIANLKLKVNVMGLIGSAENMPSSKAVKPGDILTARNGKTMEVLNTDAEGRLVLADVLSYASEQNPECIVDIATLTGAMIVALSNIYTGLFTRDANLKKKIELAGLKTGEQIWPMPLNDYHVEDIKSTVADVANISTVRRGAGSSTAAAFLEHFVTKGIPWAHLDIAGTSDDVSNRLPYCRPKSASGVMVRTFVELTKQFIR